MKITCITVGKRHDTELLEAIEKYEKRINHYSEFKFVYIPNSNIDNESDMIARQIKKEDKVLLFDESGLQADNFKLAKIIEEAQLYSYRRLILIIGGAYGVNKILKERCDQVIGLSNLVFPHQIVRLLVVEQIYRSFTILEGKN